MSATNTYHVVAGEVCEIGDLEDDKPGFRIRTDDGRIVTVTGLTRAEVRGCLPAFLVGTVLLSLTGEPQ